MTSCLITSTSNKFFPSLVNLIGSIKSNYPEHPAIFVYDLGLFPTFRKELEGMGRVTVLNMPHFVPFWRSCYTWKTHILNTPLADLNLYLDAGCQVLRPLDEMFGEIEARGYLAISQGSELKMRSYTPKEYIPLFDIDESILNKEIMTAGIFGFKKGDKIMSITEKLYQAGVAGLCLGFSKEEQWKNKGVNKNNFVRKCPAFRHDTTLLSLFLLKEIPELKVTSVDKFSAHRTGENQLIWNMRLNYGKLEHLKPQLFLNKIFVFFFLYFKRINNRIKRIS